MKKRQFFINFLRTCESLVTYIYNVSFVFKEQQVYPRNTASNDDVNCEETFLEIKLVGNLISSNQAFATFHSCCSLTSLAVATFCGNERTRVIS